MNARKLLTVAVIVGAAAVGWTNAGLEPVRPAAVAALAPDWCPFKWTACATDTGSPLGSPPEEICGAVAGYGCNGGTDCGVGWNDCFDAAGNYVGRNTDGGE